MNIDHFYVEMSEIKSEIRKSLNGSKSNHQLMEKFIAEFPDLLTSDEYQDRLVVDLAEMAVFQNNVFNVFAFWRDILDSTGFQGQDYVTKLGTLKEQMQSEVRSRMCSEFMSELAAVLDIYIEHPTVSRIRRAMVL